MTDFLRDMPPGGRAAYFVTLHVSRLSRSLLCPILGRASGLPTLSPNPRAAIKAGHIYVAPPDFHLIVGKSVVRIDHGPRENLQRPAVDAMFRSAALAHGPKVIGIILTGALDDGAAGLLEVKQRGGVAMVEDPESAQVAEMPRAAIAVAHPHLCLDGGKLSELVRRLAVAPNWRRLMAQMRRRSCRLNEGAPLAPAPIRTTIAGRSSVDGDITGFVCPECHGPLWKMRSGNRYACFVGHSYSPESLLDAKQDDLERALWTAVRTLEETAVLQRHLADKISAEKGHRLRSHFSSKARENDQSAQRIRRMIAPGTGQPRSDFSSS